MQFRFKSCPGHLKTYKNRVIRIICGITRFLCFYLRQLRVLAGRNCSAFSSALQSDGLVEIISYSRRIHGAALFGAPGVGVWTAKSVQLLSASPPSRMRPAL